ncbi:hypothetical protein L227DRAFT_566264 [Lentinus tigrinus ALCF2SS1-6]|uniref:Uncharacterized protein n=1 Tax=Lentinus tigrinus ALCF2SS1-6 TaxID=1328759 RepID=A0A5C2RYZ0_9APHY|nr:hypothetical protein L227DRAFT_566264 [Lentinus tigrinus ALCF2SS1-6]
MSDYFSLPLTVVYTFDAGTGKLSSKPMRLPSSANPSSPDTQDVPVLGRDTPGLIDQVIVSPLRAVYFVHTPTEETGPQQIALRERAVRKAKHMVREMERMVDQLERALLEDVTPETNNDPGAEVDQSFFINTSRNSQKEGTITSEHDSDEEVFSDDDEYSYCSYSSDDSDISDDEDPYYESDSDSVIVTWQSNTSLSSSSSTDSLSSSGSLESLSSSTSSSSLSSCDSVNFSSPILPSSANPPPAVPEEELSFDFEEDMSEVIIPPFSRSASRSSRIMRIFEELEALEHSEESGATLPALFTTSLTPSDCHAPSSTDDRPLQLTTSYSNLADLADEGRMGKPATEISPELPTPPAIVVTKPGLPVVQSIDHEGTCSTVSSVKLAGHVAGEEDEEDWEGMLFGGDADTPEQIDTLRKDAVIPIVRPVHEQAPFPKKARSTGAKALDCAMPIMASRCDTYVTTFIALGERKLILPLHFSIIGNVADLPLAMPSVSRIPAVTAASSSSVGKSRKKRKADDDEPLEQSSASDVAKRHYKKLKVIHAVVAPTPAPTPLPSFAQPPRPHLITSINSTKRDVSGQNMKRKRDDDDDMKHRELSSDSEDDIPLAQLIRAAKKPRIAAPTAIPRAAPPAMPRAAPTARPRAAPTARPRAAPTARPKAAAIAMSRAAATAMSRAVAIASLPALALNTWRTGSRDGRHWIVLWFPSGFGLELVSSLWVRFLSLVSGLSALVSRLWSLGSGLWSLVSGLWSLVSGLWSLVSGLWSLGIEPTQDRAEQDQAGAVVMDQAREDSWGQDDAGRVVGDYGVGDGKGIGSWDVKAPRHSSICTLLAVEFALHLGLRAFDSRQTRGPIPRERNWIVTSSTHSQPHDRERVATNDTSTRSYPEVMPTVTRSSVQVVLLNLPRDHLIRQGTNFVIMIRVYRSTMTTASVVRIHKPNHAAVGAAALAYPCCQATVMLVGARTKEAHHDVYKL